MKCPNCKESELAPVMTKNGVLVDYCPRCEGIWLDRGEIYYFTKTPKYLRWKIKDGLKNSRLSKILNPHSHTPLVGLPLRGNKMVIYYCLKTGGVWIDKEVLDEFLSEKNFFIKIEIDKNTFPSELKAPVGAPVHLPNLALTSGVTLFILYGLLSLILISLVNLGYLDPIIALIIGVGIAFVQFLISPFLMDFVLRFLYKMRWRPLERLPEKLQTFLKDISPKHNIRVPKFGIIYDGSPNAFTYGHVPNDARIIITSGLMDLLGEDELEAVVAHEIGHAVHWDMLVMTIAYVVPLILYYIFRTLIRIKTSGKDKSAPVRYAIAISSYVLYLISEYMVLGFSRVREYFADRFAGKNCNPNNLASALVKIGYGLAGKGKKKERRKPQLESIKAMGIFDPTSAVSLAISSYHPRFMGRDVDKDTLKSVMRWDLWSPWAKYYELHSTHPLIAKRLLALSRQAETKGESPYVVFNERRPESYWDEFLLDFLIVLLPVVAIVLSAVLFFVKRDIMFLELGVLLLGGTYLLRTFFSYNFSFFPEMKISSLLKKVKVSGVRPVPCRIKGKIIGRGVPGLIWSEDFVLQDDTGIIFLDYRQPLGIWNFLFGLLRAKRYQGEEVKITGWYRRAPVPYIEIKSMETSTGKSTCYVFRVKIIVGIILTLLGAVLLVLK
ncbi:M48 family metalloprotease [candidate division WOR-3 bacterium]|nr:M48 family metalloprotease [candidate division WOR-3 bacterium]